MSGLGITESEKIEKLAQILISIKNEGNLLGVIFAERTGRVIQAIDEEDLNYEEFSSMCASVLESALEISRVIGNKKIKQIITELENKLILILECDKSTFLILNARPESRINKVLNNLEMYKKKLLMLY